MRTFLDITVCFILGALGCVIMYFFNLSPNPFAMPLFGAPLVVLYVYTMQLFDYLEIK